MKKILLLGLTAFVFSCSNTSSTTAQTDAQGGGSSSASQNPNVIFEYAPQNADSLITFKALDAYQNKYKNVSGFKSFAQSESGAWAYVLGRSSQEVADLHVLDSCTKYNVRFADTYPCKLINVSGMWLDSPNRAKEILDSLPEFTPKTPIDLGQLISNANEDMQNKDYAMALVKRVWFHQYALEVNESYSAVRLSFGLGGWSRLGETYPPAKTLLRYVANYAKRTVMNDPKTHFSLVQEYVSINRVLERTDQSISFFKWLDKQHPEIASRNFQLFQDVLTQHEQFSIYNKYLNPNVDFSQMASSYIRSIDANKKGVYGDKQRSQEMLEFEANNFAYNVSRLIAILVIGERLDDAKNIAKKAKSELNSDEFIDSLNNALDGKLPTPRY